MQLFIVGTVPLLFFRLNLQVVDLKVSPEGEGFNSMIQTIKMFKQHPALVINEYNNRNQKSDGPIYGQPRLLTDPRKPYHLLPYIFTNNICYYVHYSDFP